MFKLFSEQFDKNQIQDQSFTVDSLIEICRNTLTTPFDEKITQIATHKSDFSAFLRYRNLPKNKIPKGSISDRVDELADLLYLPYYIKGKAEKQYLDYEELQQSVQTAKDAQTASIEANRKCPLTENRDCIR